jgi:predicted Zn-dependent peptidase
MPGQPAGLPILGSLETLGRVGAGDLRAFMGRNFTADRIVITGSGYFAPEEFAAQVEEYFAATPAAGGAVDSPVVPWPEPTRVVVKECEQTHFCLGYPGLPFDHPDRYVLGALTVMLGGNTSSRLFRTVREERGLAYDVFAYSHSFRDAGAVVAYAGTAPETALQTRGLILEQFRDVATAGVGAEELSRAKEYLKGTLMLSLESTSARAFRNARHEIYLGRYVSLEETLAGVDAVTEEGVRRLGRELFDRPPVAVAIGPNAEAVVAV